MTYEIPKHETDAFLEAKSNFGLADIAWESIYAIDRESYAEHPGMLEELETHMRILQDSPAGQQAFREVLLTDGREKPITVQYNAMFPANYRWQDDTMLIAPNFSVEGSMPEHMHQSFPLHIRLLHETDHAIRKFAMHDELTYYATCLPKVHAKVHACLEQTAMDRTNPVRAALGLPEREHYVYPESFAQWAIEHSSWNDLNPVQHIRDKAEDAIISNLGCQIYDEKTLQSQVNELLADTQLALDTAGVQGIDVTVAPPPPSHPIHIPKADICLTD